MVGPEFPDERLLGIAMLLVMAVLIAVKVRATASFVDLPAGSPLVKAVNIFNLLFLLAGNPLAAILLITRTAATIDPTHVAVESRLALAAIRLGGLVLYVGGYALMAWALAALGRQYQPGGSVPRPGERIVVEGPYRLVRHPMYAAALLGAFGVSFLLPSWGYLCAFCLYLGLIVPLVRSEEEGLRRVFGREYEAYRERVPALVPFVY
jgi:protein-S-isoprenylcysteine O-methyltransferase Ste14